MMNYEVFKEAVVEKILDYVSTEYQNYKVEVSEVHKVNQTLDRLNLVPIDTKEAKIAPAIFLNDMYEYYKESNNLEEILREAAGIIEKAFKLRDETLFLDFNQAKDNIIMQLINTEQNRRLLEGLPHREIKDLSIIYRWLVEVNKEGIASTMVNFELIEKLGMNEEQLFSLATVNTKRLFPPTIRSMDEIIKDILMDGGGGMSEEFSDKMTGKTNRDKRMYVVSNKRGINGAVSMLYDEVLQQLAEKLHSNFYILPSSIHEIIAVSVNMVDPNELARMVSEVNMSQVPLHERLSNQVYHYDKDLRKLGLATDTPYKRLDGSVEGRSILQ